MGSELKSFKDLHVWKISYKLCFELYKKPIENRNIKNQIERSSLSVISNIAEGFGRQSKKDKKHYYVMARGSIYEVRNQLQLLKDLELIDEEEFETLDDLSVQTVKLIHGLIKAVSE